MSRRAVAWALLVSNAVIWIAAAIAVWSMLVGGK